MRVTTKDFLGEFSAYTDAALTEPIVITKNGRSRVILLSASTFYALLDVAGEAGNSLREHLASADRHPPLPPVSPAARRRDRRKTL